MKYQIVYADPPWPFPVLKLNKGMGGKEIEDHYPSLTNEEIKNLPVKEITDKNAVLFLWTTYSHLEKALEVMRAWGFKYSTVAFEWFKLTSTGKPVCFMGKLVCGGAIEICLFGRRGSLPRKTKNVRRLIQAPRGKHSAKPPEVRDRIVALMGDIHRIELFAREKTLGWDAWGNEVKSDIKLGD